MFANVMHLWLSSQASVWPHPVTTDPLVNVHAEVRSGADSAGIIDVVSVAYSER